MAAWTRQSWRVMLVWLGLAAPAGVAFGQAGPPFISDDPSTPGNGRWEINFAYTQENREGQRLIDAPILDINFGLGGRQQLKYEVPWLFVCDDDGSRNGPGNSRVGWKYRFLDEDKSGFSMSMYPQAEFNNPTSSASRGLVDRNTRLFFPLEIARKVGRLELDAEAGYEVVLPGKDRWEYGFVAGYPVSDRLELGAEIRGTASQSFSSNELVFNVGGRWKFSDSLTLLVSAGRSIGSGRDDEPSSMAYLGLRFSR